ncbi:hypothetical protein BH09MYX1_BH09MYX1_45930 [soil metagenome]
MLRKSSFAALVVLAAFVTACSTTFNAVAPGPNNTVYVVGSHQNEAAVWVCPATGPGDCRRVEMEVGE